MIIGTGLYSLLDVASKLLSRILHERLQIIAESVLPDSQFGFQQGQSCVDMMFVARQYLQRRLGHSHLLFTLFIDLKKVYDSVPRVAFCKYLRGMEFSYFLLFIPFMKE